MPSATRQLRGPYILAAFLILATAGTTGAWWMLQQRPAARDIIDLVNIDGEHAVVVRDVHNQPDRSFLSLFSREQGERWGALIPAYAAPSAEHAAAAATAGVVAVRTIANDQPTLLFFDGVRGTKLGRLEPLGERSDPSGLVLPDVAMLAQDGQVFDAYGQDGRWAELLAVDVRQGMVLWQQRIEGASIRGLELQGSRVLVRVAGGDPVAFERATGERAADAAPASTAPAAERPRPAAAPDWLARGRAMHADGVHYVYESGREVLAAFDGQTGELLAAVELAGHGPVWPRHLANGHIWVARGASWAVLDGRSLRPADGAGASQAGRDITAELDTGPALDNAPGQPR